jgi:ribonuclease D
MTELAAAASESRPVEPLVPRHLSDRRRGGIKAAIQSGLQLPPEKHPDYIRNRGRRPTEAERRRFDELEKRRNASAHKLEMDPTLIASRSMLAELARSWDAAAPTLMIWQRELLQA